jgi:predicted O-methyltransferase YrrM
MHDDYQSIINALLTERDELKEHCERLQRLLDRTAYPPGHYYSPAVDPADAYAMRAVRERVSAPVPPGVSVDLERMQALLRRFAVHHRLWPFVPHQGPGYRFYYENPFFGCHDGSVYFSMLLEYRPRRVIEIGAGFSSCLLLDTRERFLSGDIDITLIDPSFDRLDQLTDASRLSPSPERVRLLECPLQDVPGHVFDQLGVNDILFIDSSHVAKTGSDVNCCLFEILPRLAPGVLIHVHDILYPFEYPESWIVDDKRSWNEAYIMHAFLQYNDAFEILYWNNVIYHRSRELLQSLMPLCLENEGGSLWLRKLK